MFLRIHHPPQTTLCDARVTHLSFRSFSIDAPPQKPLGYVINKHLCTPLRYNMIRGGGRVPVQPGRRTNDPRNGRTSIGQGGGVRGRFVPIVYLPEVMSTFIPWYLQARE